MSKQQKIILPLVIIFVIFNILFFAGGAFFAKFDVGRKVLLVSNALFFVLNVLTFLLHRKALLNKNPNVFVRSVMAGMVIKMLVCIIAVLAYVLTNRDNLNKRTLFAAMFLYLVYLAVEVRVLMKLNYHKNG